LYIIYIFYSFNDLDEKYQDICVPNPDVFGITLSEKVISRTNLSTGTVLGSA
jgi:hypothetical protein